MHITCITPYIRIMHVWMYKTYCTYVPSLSALSCLHMMSVSSRTNAVCDIYIYHMYVEYSCTYIVDATPNACPAHVEA